MTKDVIYPTMVIRSQEEVIKLQEKEIERLSKEVTKYDEILCEKNNEVDRLYNIIDGMEKFFKYEYGNEVRPLNDKKISVWTICLDKLKELKEGGK